MATYLTPLEQTGYKLYRNLRDWEDEFFGDSANLSACKSDLRDTGDTLILEVELPGFAKDEIHLDITGDVLTLSATHKEKTQEEKDKEGTYLRRERTMASYEQKLDVSNINTEQMQANYENGLLTLTMPKKSATQPMSRKIDIQ